MSAMIIMKKKQQTRVVVVVVFQGIVIKTSNKEILIISYLYH